MIVDDFYVLRFSFVPVKTDSILIIDTDACLAPTIAAKFFKTVARGCTEIIGGISSIESVQEFGGLGV